MFNAGPINIIPVLGYVHTPVHEMCQFLQHLPCYTIFLGRQGQHRPRGFREGLQADVRRVIDYLASHT